jgi:hypothetical protein
MQRLVKHSAGITGAKAAPLGDRIIVPAPD